MKEQESKYAQMEKKCYAELEKLKSEEDNLIQNLNNMLSQKVFLEDKMKGISKLVPALKVIKHDAQELVNTINQISDSSESISDKIRTLDLARNRVEDCQHRVGDLIDLEICSQGVDAALLHLDYEKGAGHVHRFLSMDQSLLKRTANDVDNVSDTLRSVKTLQEGAAELRAIVEHKFTEAVNGEDLASIQRFFKIFPLLGMHEEGIKKFCSYLRTKVASTADKNIKSALTAPTSDKRYSVVFADALTLLFEGLARIADTYQSLIETYYGPGHMLSAIAILQKECDIQTRRIVSEWAKHRQINKKTQTISELGRMSSSSSFSKLEKIDPKDLDMLIGEVTLMHYGIETYISFVRKKVTNDIEVGVPEKSEKDNRKKNLEKLIVDSGTSQCKHDLLSHYLRLEKYFLEESIAKVVAMDTLEQNQQTSSMVDETFFIIRKCIRRSISSGSLEGICVIINNACVALESDFCDVLKTRLQQGYPSGYLDLAQAYNVLQSSIQQGRLQSAGDTEQSRMAFIVALNNAESSTEYVDVLCEHVLEEIRHCLPNLNANEKGKLESCLSGWANVTSRLKEISDYGIQQLQSMAIKPRINQWIDAFLNINHQFEEDELSAYEAGESFAQTLIMNLETLLMAFKDILLPANYDSLTQALTVEVTQRLEKVILKCTYNRLGGLVLDKEVRLIAGYINNITATSYWSVRDKFARLTQITTVLNLENLNEIYDYWGNHDGALTWRLTPTELRSVLALRTDFKMDEIKKIKL